MSFLVSLHECLTILSKLLIAGGMKNKNVLNTHFQKREEIFQIHTMKFNCFNFYFLTFVLVLTQGYFFFFILERDEGGKIEK